MISGSFKVGIIDSDVTALLRSSARRQIALRREAVDDSRAAAGY